MTNSTEAELATGGNGRSSTQPAQSRVIRVLALVQRPVGRYPNQRFRHEQWAAHLERDHGIKLEFAPFESPELAKLLDAPGRKGRKLLLAIRDTARRWKKRHDARDFDAVIVSHEASMLGGTWMERYLARHRIPFVYDFDDAIWLKDSDQMHWTTRLWKSPSKVGDICRLASAVTVGNEYLAAYARQFNSDVHIVRTSIDIERYPVLPPRTASMPFSIVWTGSRATLQYLDFIRPALERLGKRMPVRLRVISDERPESYANVQIDFVRWSKEVEVSALGESDVGIMPLPDTPTTRGKCGLKALQYMAVGRATVVSPVGINREIVRDGENGLWAETEDGWISQLERIASDASLRQRLASAGRRTVENGYTATASAAVLAGVVRRVIAARAQPYG